MRIYLGATAAVATTTTAITGSGSSVPGPIATSTPVSLAAGPVSPPPLQSKHSDDRCQPASNTPSSASRQQYPAVLKGSGGIRTSGAAPPNPNIVPSSKVPPPVPPRGSAAKSSGSSSSARGDDDDDERFSPSAISCSTLPTRRATTAVTSHRRSTQYVQYDTVLAPAEDITDEFVQVANVNGTYMIRTSPHPFRPERGRRLAEPPPPATMCTTPNRQPSDYYTPSINMPKFTYFINPSANQELMNWKMSRKDKKFSETYSERIRRQKQLRENQQRVASTENAVSSESAPRTKAQPNNPGKRPRNLLELVHISYKRKKHLPSFAALKRQIEERLTCYNLRLSGENALSGSRDANLDEEAIQRAKTQRMFLGHAYPEWSGTKRLFRSLGGSEPNIKRTSKDSWSIEDPTAQTNLPDERCAPSRNSSFLHGYTKAK
ncbi:hypothetical protein TKK_0016481 [Trichogramma kaykai]